MPQNNTNPLIKELVVLEHYYWDLFKQYYNELQKNKRREFKVGEEIIFMNPDALNN